MVVHRHTIHPRGLSLQVKEKVYMLRKRDKKAWTDIVKEVKNVKGRRPYWKVVRAAFWALTTTKGRMKQDNYRNCGRKPILTAPLIKWVVKKMLTLRVNHDCTSADLQRCLVKEKDVRVKESAVRRVLNNEGYYYLERDKKPKYDTDQRAARVDFAKPFSKCPPQSQKDKVHLCMDGAVFTIPPSGIVARETTFTCVTNYDSLLLFGSGHDFCNTQPCEKNVSVVTWDVMVMHFRIVLCSECFCENVCWVLVRPPRVTLMRAPQCW